MSKPPRTITRCPPSAPGRGYLRWAQVAPGVPAVLVSPGRDGCIRHDHGWGGQGPGSTPAPRGTEGPPVAPMHSGKGWDGGGGELEEKGSSTDGEDTHLLASLAGNARGTREPGITHAVRVRAVTLWGAGGHVRGWDRLCPLPTAEPCQAKCPSKQTSAPQSPSCSRNGGTVPGPAPVGTNPVAPWGTRGPRPAQPQGQGEGAGWHGSLTRASSALGNWAKHWKKTQESPRDPLQGGTGGTVEHGAPHFAPLGCSAPSAPACTGPCTGQTHHPPQGPHPGQAGPAGPAYPERAQSVPSPASACCFARLPREPMPRSSGASLRFTPRPTKTRGFWALGFPPGVGRYSRGRSFRYRGHPACPHLPSLP